MKKVLVVLACWLLSACSLSAQPDGLVCVWEKLSPVGTVTVTAGQVSYVEAKLHCNRKVDSFEVSVDGKQYALQSGPYIKLALEGAYAERKVCVKGNLSYNFVSTCVTIQVQGDGTCAETPELKVGDLVRLPSVLKAWKIPLVDQKKYDIITGYNPTVVVAGPLCLEGLQWYQLQTEQDGQAQKAWARYSIGPTVFLRKKP